MNDETRRTKTLERLAEMLCEKKLYLSTAKHGLTCRGKRSSPHACSCGVAAIQQERKEIMAALL